MFIINYCVCEVDNKNQVFHFKIGKGVVWYLLYKGGIRAQRPLKYVAYILCYGCPKVWNYCTELL